MARTVVALFEDTSASKRAVDELVKFGIPRERVDVSQGRIMEDDHRAEKSEEKDGISKFFENLFGGDEKDSERYSNAARSSDCIITVHAQTQEEASKAAEILDRTGAEDVDDMAARYERDGMSARAGGHSGQAFEANQEHQQDARYQNTRSQGDTRQQNMRGQREEKSIPVVQEDVNIGKRQVETGGVRIRSRIVERPVEENLRLREEHVRVDRRKVDRPLQDSERKHFKQGDTEFVEHKEVPVVDKKARVVEEIHMSKNVDEHQQRIRDTEKKTEVDVEKLHRGQANDPTNRSRTQGNDPTSRNRTQGSDATGRNSGMGNDPNKSRKI